MWEPLDPESVKYIEEEEAAQFGKLKRELDELEDWRTRSEAKSQQIYLG